MAHRFGFGDVTETTEKGGTKKYENGHVEVSRNAFNHAIERFPDLPPAGAIGLTLATDTAGVDLAAYAGATPDWDDVRAAVQEIDGVGEETAEAVVQAMQEALADA